MSLSDPFLVRRLSARLVFRGTLRLETAAHFGGNEEGAADMMLLRDRVAGAPLLPGTSIAGALRGHLADRLAGYGRPESAAIASLFGVQREERERGGPQSAAIVFDCLGALPNARGTEIRDGVSIDPDGIATEHFKYDIEVLPAGTTFPLRIDLLVPDEPTSAALRRVFTIPPSAALETVLATLLSASLEGFSGDISLGAKRSRGLGKLSLQNVSVQRFGLGSREGWLAWLLSDHESPAGGEPLPWPVGDTSRVLDDRQRVVFQASLGLDGGILIGSPSTTPDGVDSAHLQSAGGSIISGTSVAGALRNRALRIARLVHGNEGDRWIDALFGPKETRNLVASRVRVSESHVSGGTRLRPVRIQIDRFTQGVVDRALFDEEPQFGGTTDIRLELRNPQPGEVGLLLLVLKDLLTGDLPLGGTTSVGRGVVRGSATIKIAGETLSIHPQETTAQAAGELNGWVDQFTHATVPGRTA
ncbi:MAG TPA: RAMP superfamily CRISPR-associated protein [Thermoanaerobaculia bacterium]|jgi:CRISPR/Cas system CSM-associated protein Csm3 (group 7 of RAMP superfamily)